MSDEAEDLSGGYFYRGDGAPMNQLLSNAEGMRDIYGEVYEYGYNDAFIVAAQHPNFGDYRQMLAFNLYDYKQPDSEARRARNEAMADSLLRHDPFYASLFVHPTNYWIIAHQRKKVYGPLTKEQYMRTRKTLQIPDNIQLSAH